MNDADESLVGIDILLIKPLENFSCGLNLIHLLREEIKCISVQTIPKLRDLF